MRILIRGKKKVFKTYQRMFSEIYKSTGGAFLKSPGCSYSATAGSCASAPRSTCNVLTNLKIAQDGSTLVSHVLLVSMKEDRKDVFHEHFRAFCGCQGKRSLKHRRNMKTQLISTVRPTVHTNPSRKRSF